MPRHQDFDKIHSRFITQYGEQKGQEFYHSFIEKKEYNDTKSLSSQKRK